MSTCSFYSFLFSVFLPKAFGPPMARFQHSIFQPDQFITRTPNENFNCIRGIGGDSIQPPILTLNYFELLSRSFDDAFLFISVQGNWLLTLVIWENWLMVTILKIGTGYSTWWLAVISSVRRELVGNYMFFQITISQWSINVKSPWKWISGHED